MKKQYLVASFIISSLLVPILASAATADKIQAQIQSLLTQITALQQRLSTLTSKPSTTFSTSPNSCPNLYRVLSRGSRGSDVISLQQFLIAQGLLSGDSATGFFGGMTESAVQRWQAQNSIVSYGDANTTGYGVIGPRTRAAIVTRCGTKPPVVQSCPQYQIPICTSGQHVQRGTTDANGCQGAPMCVNETAVQSCPVYNACPSGYSTNTSTDSNGCTKISCTPWQPTGSLNVSPTSGTASLKVTFTAATNAGFFGGVMIDFGDGNTASILKPGGGEKSGTMSHEYTKAGTYTAQLIGVGEGSSTVLDTKTVTVSASSVSDVADTFTASPISGTAPLVVTFSGSVTASYFGGVWIEYGDGTKKEVLCNPGGGCSNKLMHTYAEAGTYTAKMIGVGEGTSKMLKTINITVGTGTAPTESSFSATPTDGPAPLTVRFTGISGGTSIDLGDGVKSSWVDGTPPYVEYTYRTAGTYTATLRGLKGILGTATITVN